MERATHETAAHLTEAEVRQATVLKCDIVGSTRIKRGLDMDGELAFKKELEKLLSDIAQRNGGHIERFEGDGALVLFGFPSAREDPAEAAVEFGLEVLEAIDTATFVRNTRMQMRVGIASGQIAIVKHPRDSRGESAAGIVIDMAERLRAFAEPNQILICDATKRLAGGLFLYEDLQDVRVKGFEEGVRAWRVVGRSSIGSRFEAQRFDESRGRIVGRAQLLDELTFAWSDAREGKGRVVCLVGDAGIGKSRLAKAVLDRAAAEEAKLLKLDCLPSAGNTPLFPVGVLFQRLANVTAAMSEPDRQRRTEEFLTPFVDGDAMAATLGYLAPLFGLSRVTPPAGVNPSQVRDHTMSAVMRMLEAHARTSPVALLCEDLQWADDTTASMVRRVAEVVADMPILVVVTSRDTKRLHDLPQAKIIHVTPLDNADSSKLVRLVARTTMLSDEAVGRIVQRCEGNPLLLEEVTRSSVEASTGGQAVAMDTHRRGAVPVALKLVVESRLGRRPEFEPVAQAAAVLGREFSVAALQQMVHDEGASVRDALAAFADDGLFVPWDANLSDRARFKHVMFCEAVHETLLGEDRRRLHSVAADVLRRRFAGTSDASAEAVAEHLRIAERFVESIKLRLEASADTAARGAYVETEGHCEGALQLVDKVEEIDQGRELQFALLLRLGVAKTGRHGYASPEAETVYRRALEICGEGAEAAKLYPIIRGIATFNLVQGKLAAAYDLSLRGLELAERSARVEFRIDAMSVLCYTTLYFRPLVDCREWIDRCLAMYRDAKGEQLHYPGPQDAATAALALLPTVEWLLGDPDAADAAVEQGLAHVERLDRNFDRALMHAWIAGTRYTQRRYEQSEQHAMIAAGISQQHDYREWLGVGALMAALAKAARSPSPEAMAQAQKLCEAFKNENIGLNASYYLLGLARGCSQLGDKHTALGMLNEAFRCAEASEETRMNAELLLLQAEFEPDDAAAMALLARAKSIAEDQGAAPTMLRAVAAIALRAGDVAHAAEAREALAALDRGPPYPAQPRWMHDYIARLCRQRSATPAKP